MPFFKHNLTFRSRNLLPDFRKYFRKNICATKRLHLYLQLNSCISKSKEMRRDVFQALADPTRRAIIALIAIQAMTPNAVAEHFMTTRQAVSKHIKILTECELLTQQQSGRTIYYHFNPQKMKEVADFIEPYRKMWESRFDQLDQLLNQLT